MTEAPSCSICCQSMEEESRQFLVCAHSFHDACIVNYCREHDIQIEQMRCPECRLSAESAGQRADALFTLPAVEVVPDEMPASPMQLNVKQMLFRSQASEFLDEGEPEGQEEPSSSSGNRSVGELASQLELDAALDAAAHLRAARAGLLAGLEQPAGASATPAASTPAEEANVASATPTVSTSGEEAIVADETPAAIPTAEADETQIVPAAEGPEASLLFNFDKVVLCSTCGKQCSIEKARVRNKGQGVFQCNSCGSTITKVSRKCPKGSVAMMNRLPQDRKEQLMKRCAGLSTSEVTIIFQEYVDMSTMQERSYINGGKFQPISYWRAQGYDVDVIEASSLPCDMRPHRLFGTCYRVPIEEVYHAQKDIEVSGGRGQGSSYDTMRLLVEQMKRMQ